MPGLTKPSHWIVLLLVILLLFGAKRLPDLAKGVGQSLKIFKKEIKDLQEDDEPKPAPPAVSATAEPIATPQVVPTPAPVPTAVPVEPKPVHTESQDNA